MLHAAIILGLTRLGVITLSGRNPRLPKELRIDALLTDSAYPYEAARVIRVDAGWLEGKGTSSDGGSKPADEHRICRIILTSGTTGEAKAVALTHRMLQDRLARHLVVLGNKLPQCSRTYCDLGFATSLGFQFLIYTLWRGGTILFPGGHLEEVIQLWEAYQIKNMVSTPSSLAQYLRYFEGPTLPQCNMEMILAAGSLLSESLARRVRARICSNIISLYGSTEASMVAAAPAHFIADTPGAVGYVTPGVTVEIVDQAGTALPPGQAGIVRIRSPYGPGEYFGDALESANAFRDGWFYPGDIGRLAADGLLVIEGRQTAVLNVGGDKLRPELVEEVITSFPEMDRAGVFSVANELGIEELWSLVVARARWDEGALRAHCQRILPEAFVPLRFIEVERLPVNAMGKIDRRLLHDIARARLG